MRIKKGTASATKVARMMRSIDSEVRSEQSRINGKKGGRPKQFIVKVQVSLFTSDGSNLALIYNEDRSVLEEMPISKEILSAMDDEPKAFFYAIKRGETIELLKEAPWQDW